ncbi:Zn-dependent hydrolase [Seiridium cupressi]
MTLLQTLFNKASVFSLLRSTFLGNNLFSSAVLGPLRADLYNTPAIAVNETLPDGTTGFWQPTVITLISGQSEAVLVDVLFTHDQAVATADWLDDVLGVKRLATIYITHGHGDHWFNLAYLKARFPGVDIVSTQSAVDLMATQSTPEYRSFWQESFPGQIDDDSFEVLARPLANNTFALEGHSFYAIDVGHSDTENTTFLWIPDLEMAVCGDIVYNDVHPWMRESPRQSQRDAWVASLEKVAAYNPSIVIGAHHRLGAVDGAVNINETKNYIETYSELVNVSKTAEELYHNMIKAFPNRAGHGVLWLGCQAVVPSNETAA